MVRDEGMERPLSFRLYKANKTNTGGAFRLDLNPERKAVFLEAAGQMNERRFDWENKITMKLSVDDLGRLIALFQGKVNSIRLFHEPGKGEYESSKETKNTVLELVRSDRGYLLKLSQQSMDNIVSSVQVPISIHEGEIVRVLLEKAIIRIHKW